MNTNLNRNERMIIEETRKRERFIHFDTFTKHPITHVELGESDEDNKTVLQPKQIQETLASLLEKWIIQYTGTNNELFFVLYTKIPEETFQN
jgi:hypothetical protein